MAWYNNFFVTQKQLNEAIDSFKGKGDDSISDREWKKLAGEGIEDVNLLQMWGMQGLMGYNNFFNSYINKAFENEVQRIMEYRNMAAYPEIGDVIEDAANEACQPDYNMNLVSLNILDEKIKSNTNIQKVINREFEKLFFEKIDINDRLWKLFKDFLTDGRIFYERIIDRNNSKKGIINIKQLPAESIDYEINPITGKIMTYYQYLVPNMKRPVNRQEAERLAGDGVTGKDKKLVIFNPEQIGFINYGLYGRNLYELLGYLEKAKVPYNQLKLLETSVIIYRLVRSPQRLVFKIDTGSMPRDKAMKYVERVKQKFIKKQTYDPRTGNLSFEPEVLSLLENYYIPTSSDGKGSSIETIGGDAKGFTELDDIYYFSRKLYRALKYPISRITQGAEKGEEVMFGGSGNQIARDEIKWAKFLERQQRIFCDEFLELFLLHLEFRGLKKEYNLDYNSFSINMNPPSHYNEQMEQTFKEQEFANYNQLKDDPAFSKSYLIRKHLKWTDKDFAENKKGFDQDKKYFPQEKVEDTSYLSGMGAPGEAGMMPGGMPGAPGTEDIGFEEEPTEEGTEKEFV